MRRGAHGTGQFRVDYPLTSVTTEARRAFRLPFALSKQDIREEIVSYDLG